MPAESVAIPNPPSPFEPPGNVEKPRVPLVVSTVETNATLVLALGEPAGGGPGKPNGIVFVVTGKSVENVAPVRYTRVLGPSAIAWPTSAVVPAKQVEYTRAGAVGVARLISAMNTVESGFFEHEVI